MLFSNFVPAADDKTTVIAKRNKRRVQTCWFARLEPRFIENRGNEMVALLSRIRDAHGRYDHAQHLKHLEACDIHAESNYIFISF